MDLVVPWTGWMLQDGGENAEEMATMCKEKGFLEKAQVSYKK
jgi:hypothetical protein